MADAADDIIHPTVPDLDGLIERLRQEDDLRIGLDRHVMAAALLERLARAGIRLERAEAAADWLAPVLCTSARDQGALRARLIAEAPAGGAEQTTPPQAGSVAPRHVAVISRAETAARSVSRPWLLWAIIGCVAVVALVTMIDVGAPPIPAGPGSANDAPAPAWFGQPLPTDQAGEALVAVPAFVTILVWQLIARRRRSARVRIAVDAAQIDLPLSGSSLAWFQEGRLRTALRGLRQHASQTGRFLNLPQTIRQTVHRAGTPVIIRGGRPKLPEHVVLVGLNHAGDQLRVPVEALLRCLREGGVHSETYAFFGNPRSVQNWATGVAENFSRMALRHRGARLLVVSDARSFYDRLADAPIALTPLQEFTDPVLLSPEPSSKWSLAEHALRGGGWFIAEFRSEGVRQVAQWLVSPREPVIQNDDFPEDMPDLAASLERDAALNNPRRPPSPQRLQRLINELRGWLGEEAFSFLAVLAFGSHVSPETTDVIAGHLAALGVKLPHEEALARLMRLPWMREGALPPWLRSPLVEQIPEALISRAKTAWLLHLAGEVSPRRYSESEGAALIAPQDLNRLKGLAWDQLRATGNERADDLLRRAIGETTETTGAAASQWLDFGWRGTAAGLVAGIAAAILLYFAETQAARLTLLLVGGGSWILSVVPHAVGGTGWILLMTLLAGLPRRPRVDHALSAVVIVLAVCYALAAAALYVKASHDMAAVNMAIAEALLAAGALRRLIPAKPETMAVHALFSPAHPWANLAVVGALAAMSVPLFGGPLFLGLSTLGLAFPISDSVVSTEWLSHELGALAAATILGAALAMRTRLQRAASTAATARAAVLFVGGQALGGAIFYVALATVMTQLGLGAWMSDFHALWNAFDINARLVFGLSMAVAAFAQPAWPLPNAVVVLRRPPAKMPAVSAAILAGGIGLALFAPLVIALMPEMMANLSSVSAVKPWVWIVAYGPWPLVATFIVTISMFRATAPVSRTEFGQATILLSASTALLGLAWYLDSAGWFSLLPPLLAVYWLLCWLLVRGLRADLVALRGDGLWWRALALVPCWLGTSVWGLGGSGELAVPVAGWLAARYGMRALPALSLALAPMALIGLDLSIVRITPSLGWTLSALLIARFVSDHQWRAAALAQDRVGHWQIAGLVLLTFGGRLSFGEFTLAVSLYPLLLTLLGFIGLSGSPIRRLINTLVLTTVTETLLSLSLGGVSFLSFGLGDVPSLVGAVLILVSMRIVRIACELSRPDVTRADLLGLSDPVQAQKPNLLHYMLVSEALDVPRSLMRLIEWLCRDDRLIPRLIIAAAMIDCLAVGVYLGVVRIDPFFELDLAIAALFLGAAEKLPLMAGIAISGWLRSLRVPQWISPAAAMGIAVGLLSSLPSTHVQLLPLQVGVRGPHVIDISLILEVIFAYWMGQALVDAYSPPVGVIGLTPEPWRATTRLGLLAAAGVVITAIAAMIYSLWQNPVAQDQGLAPPIIDNPFTNPNLTK